MNDVAILDVAIQIEANLSADAYSAAEAFASKTGLPCISSLSEANDRLVLQFSSSGTSLILENGTNTLQLAVDFTAGSADHRRKFGGGKGQMIARAVGINSKFCPLILDATVGLGRDAFVLASLGAQLTLLERSPIVRLLLNDGMERAREFAVQHDDSELLAVLDRMDLKERDSRSFLDEHNDEFDVVYLDPMFPERKKTAMVKKDMQIFHKLVGADDDSDELLDFALKKARYRVVVKRPRHAPNLGNKKPSYVLEGKSSRFDIYTLKAIPQ